MRLVNINAPPFHKSLKAAEAHRISMAGGRDRQCDVIVTVITHNTLDYIINVTTSAAQLHTSQKRLSKIWRRQKTVWLG